MNKYTFTPDIFKYEEEFMIEAESLSAAIEKLEEVFPYNCLLAVFRLDPYGLVYVGVVELSEGNKPKFIETVMQLHDGDRV